MSFARMRAFIVVGALVVAAGVFVVVALVKDTQSDAAPVASCPEGFVPVDLSLPDPKTVKINVFNATDTAGLATQVSEDLKNREFQVQKVGNDPEGRAVDGVALLRYGPKAVGSAHVLRAFFLDEAKPEFDIERQDDVVDVVIGTQFQQIGTQTEVNQSIGALGNPVLPKGTCEADS